MLARDQLPAPDRVMVGEPQVAADQLHLDYDGQQLIGLDDGRYRLRLARGAVACDLLFAPRKVAVRHRKGRDERFSDCIPRCAVTGTVQLDGTELPVESGTGCYGHELVDEADAERTADVSSNRLSAHLDNGWDVIVYDAVEADTRRSLNHHVVLIDPAGRSFEHDAFTFEPFGRSWTSTRTFEEWPQEWRLNVPAAGLHVIVTSPVPHQELITLLSGPSRWSGRVQVRGTFAERPVAGPGYVERVGFTRTRRLEDFLEAVSRETRRHLLELIPAAPTEREARELIGSGRRPHYLEGVDLEQFARTVLQPIRDTVSSGKQAWRAYGLLACIEALGGDPEAFRAMLALPELLYAGALMVDDVGRVGQRPVGERLAINAGCASYFFAELTVRKYQWKPAHLLALFDLYFEVMRAAHAGRALDLDGLAADVPAVLECGGDSLERRVLATHRLKSAVAPAALARVAGVLAEARPEAIEAMAGLFEALGLSFQIVDDVRSVREDLSGGKVTYPLARALGKLGPAERRELWSIISAKTRETAQIGRAVELTDGCGALTDGQSLATRLIDDAWKRAEPFIPDAHVKLKLRAFGWYLLEQQG